MNLWLEAKQFKLLHDESIVSFHNDICGTGCCTAFKWCLIGNIPLLLFRGIKV